ncbi:hypothetical protein NDU88_001685 [Pleurodeles waltl]|uniref:Uncharacterized protein n=1 Tax=Pleurodeles waltl TaxID=8319 RepID=A0AAV7LI52_PLEWA|nr:hypothetical protein NDU88_001685 [Pleurodeles waltl]
MQVTPEEQEEVHLVEEVNLGAVEGGLALDPELQHHEEELDCLPTGVKSPATAVRNVPSDNLFPEELEDRKSDRELTLQLAKWKLSAEEKKAAADKN